MEDPEGAQEEPRRGDVNMSAKNYHKQIECPRCGRSVRDDRLREHQQSARCQSQDVVLVMSAQIHEQIMSLSEQMGFFQEGNRLKSIDRAENGQQSGIKRAGVDPGRKRADLSRKRAAEKSGRKRQY